MPKSPVQTIETELVQDPKGAIVALNSGDSALGLSLRIEGLAPAHLIQWLQSAVPAYETARTQMAQAAVAIGYALIVVRDFGERGSLERLKKLQAFGRSSRTLKRCIALAQKFIVVEKLVDPKSHKLKASADINGFFQAEFDFAAAPEDSIMARIRSWAGDHSISDLLERDALGASPDEKTLPPSGRKKPDQRTPEERRRDDFKKTLKALQEEWLAESFKELFSDDSIALEIWLEKAWREVSEHNRNRPKAKAKKP